MFEEVAVAAAAVFGVVAAAVFAVVGHRALHSVPRT
jgi:hypothetical protein